MESPRIVDVPVEELLAESWEGTLRRLTADMDPWDIDVGELARRYRSYLDALQELQFEIPGRMVLTCSILLRLKSDDLLASAQSPSQGELIDELERAVDEAAVEWEEPVEPDEFALPLLRRPRRPVTLFDLRKAFAAAMKVSRRRTERLISHIEAEEFDPFDHFEIGGDDFNDRLLRIFDKIKRLLSGRRILSFFRLLERGDKDERVKRFFEILHLAARGQITCQQDEFLGDIVIAIETEN